MLGKSRLAAFAMTACYLALFVCVTSATLSSLGAITA